MFINLTNHPSDKWSAEQRDAAKEYGEIVDIPFPDISPETGEDAIKDLAEQYVEKILSYTDNNAIAVHVMGEMTFVHALVTRLKENGIRCVASTTERMVKEEDGKKISEFKFVQFREY